MGTWFLWDGFSTCRLLGKYSVLHVVYFNRILKKQIFPLVLMIENTTMNCLNITNNQNTTSIMTYVHNQTKKFNVSRLVDIPHASFLKPVMISLK